MSLTVGGELRKRRFAQRWAGPYSHGGSQGFKSPHLHSQSRRSERRQRHVGDARCMSGPRWGRAPDSRSTRKGLLYRTTPALGPRDDHGA
jgi:hypothetical protein